MNRRDFIVISAASVLLASRLCSAVPNTENAKPNIIIILADDLGYADVSFNGGEIPTPAIDRIADEGVNLKSFYACPVCTPTRAGLLTGRYPIRFGCMRAVIPPWRKRGMPPQEHTFAELCRQAGYTRRAAIGKWHLGHNERKYLPNNQGFNHFYGHYNGAIDYFTHMREGEVDWHRNAETIKEEGYSTELLGAEAVEFIDEAVKAEEAFLLYLPFNAPHSPFQALEKDLRKFPNLKGKRKTYAAMVTAMDRAVENVLDTLDKHGIAENTFVLFASDNGGLVQVARNKPWRGGKFDVYDGGTRVAAAARWPAGGIEGGRIVDSAPIGYIDVYPAIKHIIGLQNEPDPNPLDGIDVLDLMRGRKRLPARDWFSYLHQGGPDEKWAVISGDYKLIAYTRDILGNEKIRLELYHRGDDPAEKNNLAKSKPEICEEMLAKLKEFRKLQKNPLPKYGVGKKGFRAPKDWIVDWQERSHE